MEGQSAWLLLSFGDERTYSGNVGYADEFESVYKYDSFVQNHKRLRPGDIAILQNRTGLLGVARIARIDEIAGTKIQHRCPRCRSTALKTRKLKRPPLACSQCKYEFADPLIEEAVCQKFSAFFDGSFVHTPGALSLGDLRGACPNYNGQLSMQPISFDRVSGALRTANSAVDGIFDVSRKVDLFPEDAQDHEDTYVPGGLDQRAETLRMIRGRRGQRLFRDAMLSRYKNKCVVTGCTLTDILEAAHICAHRGPNDNHPSNGLLLRADMHTLFDLDLLGIAPSTLTIHLSSSAALAYPGLQGTPITIDPSFRPSEAALTARWIQYQARSTLMAKSVNRPRVRAADAGKEQLESMLPYDVVR